MNDLAVINVLAHTDLLDIIINDSKNINLTLVCKDIYHAIVYNSKICPDCHKIIKIYNHIVWLTDDTDDQCHGCRFSTLQEYREIKSILTTYPKYLKMLTPCHALYKHAIKNHPNAIKYIDQTPELSLMAVQENGLAIKYIKNQTPELCQIAMRYPKSFPYIHDKTVELCKKSLSHYDNIRYIPEDILENILSQNDVNQIINANVSLIEYIPLKFQTDKICDYVIKKDHTLIHFIKHRKEHYCRMMYSNNKNYFDKLFKSTNLENETNFKSDLGCTAIGNNSNTAIGNNSYGYNSAYGNVALGHNALSYNNGSNNTAFGTNSGYRCESKNNNLFIANKGDYHDDGVIRIGNHKQIKNYQAGIYNNAIEEGYPVYITKDGLLGIKRN